MWAAVAVPPGFAPLTGSPFAELIGPLYVGATGEPPLVAIEVQARHANRLGRGHGGLVMTLADVALSRAVRAKLPPGTVTATASLHIAFLDGVRVGQWLEAASSVDRTGRSLVHASCVVRSEAQEVARALATFAVRLTHLS